MRVRCRLIWRPPESWKFGGRRVRYIGDTMVDVDSVNGFATYLAIVESNGSFIVAKILFIDIDIKMLKATVICRACVEKIYFHSEIQILKCLITVKFKDLFCEFDIIQNLEISNTMREYEKLANESLNNL